MCSGECLSVYYTVVHLFYIFNNQRQAVGTRVSMCACEYKGNISVCVSYIKPLCCCLFRHFIQHVSESCGDIATCTDNSTTSPLSNLTH